MDIDDFFPRFADWARTTSLEQASTRFGLVIEVEIVDAYVSEYRRRMDDIEDNGPPFAYAPCDSWYPVPGETDKYRPALEKFFETSLGGSDANVKPVDRSSNFMPIAKHSGSGSGPIHRGADPEATRRRRLCLRRGTSNGSTEAINGCLEHLRRSALGFRNLTNYVARLLLEAGGFRPGLHLRLG